MAGLKRRVIIDTRAQKSLKEAVNYIRKDPFDIAEKVKKCNIGLLKRIIKNSERHPPDKYRIENDAPGVLMKFKN